MAHLKKHCRIPHVQAHKRLIGTLLWPTSLDGAEVMNKPLWNEAL